MLSFCAEPVLKATFFAFRFDAEVLTLLRLKMFMWHQESVSVRKPQRSLQYTKERVGQNQPNWFKKDGGTSISLFVETRQFVNWYQTVHLGAVTCDCSQSG